MRPRPPSILTASVNEMPGCALLFGVFLEPLALLSPAVGVGHKPEPVSIMRGTNGGSRYAMPLCIKPERGQVSENRAHPSIKQRCDVLHDCVLGSFFANNSGVLRP